MPNFPIISTSTLKKIIAVSIFFLAAVAAIALLWSIYRSFLGIMVNANEGWNAFFADAAMGKMKLYPSPDQLITNNYPPLSFYLVGFVGKIVGDNILAGRLISLIAVGVIAFFITKIIKTLGGSQAGALIGASYFVATLSIFFRWYVGANDPQLLAQAIMIIGFFLFLKAVESDCNYGIAIVVMVLAGFFKHNNITFPLVAFLWLAYQRRWKTFFFCAGVAVFALLIGFGACWTTYGIDFYYNFTTPRQYLWIKVSDAFDDLGYLFLGLFFWLVVSWKCRREPAVQLVTLMVSVGLIVGFLQRLGNGVFVNAQFDLVIALSVALGMAFTLLARAGRRGMWWQLAGVMVLSFSFLRAPSFLDIFSPEYHARLAESEKIMAQRIELVRQLPGDVFCESYVAYRAGKPFAVDALNIQERMRAGRLPKETLTRRLEENRLQGVDYVWDVGLE